MREDRKGRCLESPLRGVLAWHGLGFTQGWSVYHERYDLCSLYGLDGTCRYRNRQRALARGQSLLLAPGEVSHGSNIVGGALFVLSLSPRFVEQSAPGLELHDCRLIYDDPEIERRIRSIVDGIVGGATALDIECRIVATLVHMVAQGGGDRPLERVLRFDDKRLRALVDQNLHRPIRLQEMADLVGMSRFHFVRCFHEQFEVSPARFVALRRAARALSLLMEGQTVSHTVGMLNYTDRSHLARWMRRTYGMTPRALQRTTREILDPAALDASTESARVKTSTPRSPDQPTGTS